MTEIETWRLLVGLAARLYTCGHSVGNAGNVCRVYLMDGYLITPTNSSLGHLDPIRLSKLDSESCYISGDPPSNEVFMHRGLYTSLNDPGAVVHLHSTMVTAVTCLPDRGSGPINCLARHGET